MTISANPIRQSSPASGDTTRWGWRVSLLPLLPALITVLAPPQLSGWLLMWLLAVSIYLGCKWLAYSTTSVPSTMGRNLAYWLAWPGLDAPAFLRLETQSPIAVPQKSEWFFAALKTVFGGTLLVAAIAWSDRLPPLAVGWLGMLGLIFSLHFGLFHGLSCWWRSRGVDAPRLMNAPLAATSISDFWGRRWNIAFRDLTHRFLFRPLAARLGPQWAVMLGFAFSGVVHDFVISYPAGDGYGWPTAYFLLQGCAILLERSRWGKQVSLHHGWRGKMFAAVVLITPLTWLFHRPFVENIIVPMLLTLKEIG
ncbi:membrane bound O-acyl transferase family-domain-containing protein [Blastopirellula sp. J2-11]|uniref:wax synthase family protein n=1 Tax=Blastopirellula sp. J2-11 TaxID=2943192 RepID=UPI0021C6FA33|nr:membrane bound O-acyl transferase family-domain-containing protein [Blastopirellula sp. J2-11]UUO05627.1 membrane bound O-acyl transferase family-domain-containing protein [Blastopirellula sp. J2-11]